MAQRHSKVLILGSGAAGLTAAIYTARAGLAPVLIHSMQWRPDDNHDRCGKPSRLCRRNPGPMVDGEMQAQAESVAREMIADMIVEADLATRPFTLTGDSGDDYSCDTLIISTGAQAKWLGLESEQAFQGFGVSACATYDGFFFREKNSGSGGRRKHCGGGSTLPH